MRHEVIIDFVVTWREHLLRICTEWGTWIRSCRLLQTWPSQWL